MGGPSNVNIKNEINIKKGKVNKNIMFESKKSKNLFREKLFILILQRLISNSHKYTKPHCL